MAFPFYCCTSVPSSEHSISLVSGHYHLGGCADFCPGKAILQHIKHFASFLNARHEKRIKLFCKKGVTRQADHKEMGESALYHCIFFSSNRAVIPSVQAPKGCKYMVPERERHGMHGSGTAISHACCGSLNPHIKKPHQSSSFPPDHMTKLFWFAFFFIFFFSDQKSVTTANYACISQEIVFPKWTLLFLLR